MNRVDGQRKVKMEQSKQKKLESHGEMDDLLGQIGKLAKEEMDKPVVTLVHEKEPFENELVKKLTLLKSKFGSIV